MVREYVAELEEKEIKIDKVIVFGSQAKGTVSKRSDIDIAIVSDASRKGKYNSSHLFRKLWKVKNSNIDPIEYPRKEIWQTPLLLYYRKYTDTDLNSQIVKPPRLWKKPQKE